ncbi:hypothetical protein Bbelb_148590 [Branchiostoma belcheri]|nr:hypothetical protein Bbelb_148590 [Branchiostoma belcheri]
MIGIAPFTSPRDSSYSIGISPAAHANEPEAGPPSQSYILAAGSAERGRPTTEAFDRTTKNKMNGSPENTRGGRPNYSILYKRRLVRGTDGLLWFVSMLTRRPGFREWLAAYFSGMPPAHLKPVPDWPQPYRPLRSNYKRKRTVKYLDLNLIFKLNSTRAPLTTRRRDLIVRTPGSTPPVAGIPPGHISYVTDQMNRIKTMPARLLNPAGASRGYIPDGHRRRLRESCLPEPPAMMVAGYASVRYRGEGGGVPGTHTPDGTHLIRSPSGGVPGGLLETIDRRVRQGRHACDLSHHMTPLFRHRKVNSDGLAACRLITEPNVAHSLARFPQLHMATTKTASVNVLATATYPDSTHLRAPAGRHVAQGGTDRESAGGGETPSRFNPVPAEHGSSMLWPEAV